MNNMNEHNDGIRIRSIDDSTMELSRSIHMERGETMFLAVQVPKKNYSLIQMERLVLEVAHQQLAYLISTMSPADTPVDV